MIASTAAFPPTIVVVGIAALALAVWVPARRGLVSPGGSSKRAAVAVRTSWLTIAVLGLAALVGDVRTLS